MRDFHDDGAAAPGLAAPERLLESVPERLVGHARAGVDPEARTPAGRPASQGQTSSNADIVVEHGDEGKQFTTLPDLAARINNATGAAESSAKSAMQHALEAGRLLVEAKTLVQHGQWANWLLEHCTVAPRTAQAYMRLSTKLPALPAPEAQRVADLPVREAMRAIATDPTPPKTVPTVHLATRSDADRVKATLIKAATEMRSAARYVDTGMLRGQQITKMRAKLVAAIEAIDKLAAGEVQS